MGGCCIHSGPGSCLVPTFQGVGGLLDGKAEHAPNWVQAPDCRAENRWKGIRLSNPEGRFFEAAYRASPRNPYLAEQSLLGALQARPCVHHPMYPACRLPAPVTQESVVVLQSFPQAKCPPCASTLRSSSQHAELWAKERTVY